MTFGHHTDRRKNGAFPCPLAHCDGMMDVVDSYGVEDGIRRRRQCRKCAARVTTHEIAQAPKYEGGRVFWRHTQAEPTPADIGDAFTALLESLPCKCRGGSYAGRHMAECPKFLMPSILHQLSSLDLAPGDANAIA